jgi:16S rRNA (guanine1207-N2)-methyltransferase
MPSRPHEVELHLPDLSLRLRTDRGVFARGGIDPGTKLLLAEPALVTVPDAGEAAPPAAIDVLDLGAGYGPIALTLARRLPHARVWAVDVNERARALCQTNAAANDLTNITVAAPDGIPDTVTFTSIWSNPPIRIGKAALHELLTRWLGRLTPDGTALLVVQKHLGADSLAAWLGAGPWTCERVTSRGGYRILRVRPR